MKSNKMTNIFRITLTDKDTGQDIFRDYNMNGISNEELGNIMRDMLNTVQLHPNRIPF